MKGQNLHVTCRQLDDPELERKQTTFQHRSLELLCQQLQAASMCQNCLTALERRVINCFAGKVSCLQQSACRCQNGSDCPAHLR